MLFMYMFKVLKNKTTTTAGLYKESLNEMWPQI